MPRVIMGIELEQRRQTATDVQSVLTDYGCSIKTRIGLHTATDNEGACSEKGLIILELTDDSMQTEALEGKLTEIDGVNVKKIEF